MNHDISHCNAEITPGELYNYSFVVTFNIESLQWFLSQREKKAAHWDIQNFAAMLRNNIPEEYKYLFNE
jgi:thymidylate synthase ThyX